MDVVAAVLRRYGAINLLLGHVVHNDTDLTEGQKE